MNSSFERIGVLGAGAWGTALAQVAALAGRQVVLWAREEEAVRAIQETRENALFLPGEKLHSKIEATLAIEDLSRSDAILAVAPAQHMRSALRSLKPVRSQGAPVVLCAKGIEQGSLALMSDVLAHEIPDCVGAVLSGPSFARDVVRGLPTAVTLACQSAETGARLAAAIGLTTFRPYLADDLIGAEIGGAVKNVLAIACGVADGRGLGDSARAALITRGFAEMTRLGLAMGAKRETMNGLCGLGDLVLTCSSKQSRNYSLGFALGEGKSREDARAGRRDVAEGELTAPALVALAARHGVEMPIAQATDALLAGRINVEAAIIGLLSRPFRAENA